MTTTITATRHRRITLELSIETSLDHPLQNMAALERLLQAALENGIKTADADIPPVMSANVLVLGTFVA